MRSWTALKLRKQITINASKVRKIMSALIQKIAQHHPGHEHQTTMMTSYHSGASLARRRVL
jgi:hypothetical protein